MGTLAVIITIVGLVVAIVYMTVVPIYVIVEHRIFKKVQEEVMKRLKDDER